MRDGVAAKNAAKVKAGKPLANGRAVLDLSTPTWRVANMISLAAAAAMFASVFLPWLGRVGDTWTLVQVKSLVSLLAGGPASPQAGVVYAVCGLLALAGIAAGALTLSRSKTARASGHIAIGVVTVLVLLALAMALRPKLAAGNLSILHGFYVYLVGAVATAGVGVWERSESDVFSRLSRFVRDSYIEVVKKAAWPTWSDLKKFTAIVILAIIVVGVWVGGMDALLSWFTRKIGFGVIPK